MGRNRGKQPLRQALGALAAALLLCGLGSGPAAAQLLPEGFFDQSASVGGEAEVEANILGYDAVTGTISAEGDVVLRYEGYTLVADKVSFNPKTGVVLAEGRVSIEDPIGNVYMADRIEVTDELKKGFVQSLTIRTTDGATIEATEARYIGELTTILTDATYSPCGRCIDSKGRRIGWKVHASKITYDRDNAVVYADGPVLELLGIPMAWLPWMVIPDPSQPRARGFRTPTYTNEEKFGARLDIPYFWPVSDDIDLILTPTLMSRQGALMQAEWIHRLPMGTYDVKASGLYQLDPTAFTFSEAQVNWRGAIQTTGRFTPVEDWTVGWSYTAFTDAAYLIDYKLSSSKNSVNEVYATYLTDETYFDVRLRKHNLLGDVLLASQSQQASQIPRVEAAHYMDLEEYGQIRFSAFGTNIYRSPDAGPSVFNGVPYIFGYAGNKAHATLEASWQNQYVLPGGVTATPYLGIRADASYYDGSSPLLPGAVSLLNATPIAAMDIRWPWVAVDGLDSHVFEPIAQLVYRGSSTTLTGITNDDAQSFVFDDTLLFSYNRFSGTDRQETGLRLNVGGRYMANFEDGSWLQLIGGQSYFLAGTNALGIVDHAQTGNSSGLGGGASYIVLGAQGSPGYGLNFGAKTQLDSSSFTVRRAAVASSLALGDYQLGLDYTYIPANPAVGTIADQHEATFSASGPLPFDYWYANGSVSWDLAQSTWLEATAGVTYDDGYLVVGAFGSVRGPTHSSPNSYSTGFKFRLRGPAGEWGY